MKCLQGELATTAKQNKVVAAVWGIFFAGLIFLESIGFLVYGRRLVNLMPPQLAKKMQAVRMRWSHSFHSIPTYITHRISCLIRLQITKVTSAQAIGLLICWVIAGVTFGILPNSAIGIFVSLLLVKFVEVVIIVLILLLFVKPQRKFPFITFDKGMKNMRNSSNSNSGATHDAAVGSEGSHKSEAIDVELQIAT